MSECNHENQEDFKPECEEIPLGTPFLRFQASKLMSIAASLLDEANRLDGIRTGV